MHISWFSLFRLPQIYDEFYHTVNNADHDKDLRWWSNTHGVNMPMAWPQFEVGLVLALCMSFVFTCFKKRSPLLLHFCQQPCMNAVGFSCFVFCPFLPVFVAYPVWWVQEYTEEFREIAPRSKKNLGGVADGNITLINQRSVCDDLPVCTPTYLHPPLIDASQNLTMCTIFICLFSLFYKSV